MKVTTFTVISQKILLPQQAFLSFESTSDFFSTIIGLEPHVNDKNKNKVNNIQRLIIGTCGGNTTKRTRKNIILFFFFAPNNFYGFRCNKYIESNIDPYVSVYC